VKLNAVPIAELNALHAAAVHLVEVMRIGPIHETRDLLVPRLRRALIRMWRRQGRRINANFLPMAKVHALFEATPPPPLHPSLLHLIELMLGEEHKEWADTFALIMGEAAVEAGAQMLADFGLAAGFDNNFPVARVVEELKTRALTLVKGLNDTTLNRIRALLADGIENHQSYSAVARTIRDLFREMGMFAPGATRDRASMIAVHEIGQAYTNAQLAVGAAMQDTGLGMEKFWQTVEDDRVEAECEGNQAEGWIPFDQEFSSGDDAPLAHVGCRCAVLMRLS
jgi:hypothetical protein